MITCGETSIYRGVPSPFVYVSLTLRCCGGVAGSDAELELTNGACLESGDMIIANDGESVCVALWPGAGAGEDEEDEDAVVVVVVAVAGCGGSADNGVGVDCGCDCGGGSAAGVWRLHDGLPYGDTAETDASPSGYFRLREAEGGVMGTTTGRRLSSPPPPLLLLPGSTAGAASGVMEDEVDRRRTEDEDAEGEGTDMAVTGAGGGGADADAGTGRRHLTSQGGGGGMCAPGVVI